MKDIVGETVSVGDRVAYDIIARRRSGLRTGVVIHLDPSVTKVGTRPRYDYSVRPYVRLPDETFEYQTTATVTVKPEQKNSRVVVKTRVVKLFNNNPETPEVD